MKYVVVKSSSEAILYRAFLGSTDKKLKYT